MTGSNPSHVRYRRRRLLVDDQLKNIWSGIVTHYIKVELAPSDFGQIEERHAGLAGDADQGDIAQKSVPYGVVQLLRIQTQ
jgi:hypothetical protein